MARGGFSAGKGRPSLGSEAMEHTGFYLPVETLEEVHTRLIKNKEARKVNPKIKRVTKSDILRTAVEIGLKHDETAAITRRIPLLGVIYGGPAQRIQSMGDNATIEVPFKVSDDAYGLLVVGDSMESDDGVSIASGNYAIFEPQAAAQHGSLVHVEWNNEKEERICTFKKYIPRENGGAIFRPLNGRHKPITREPNTFEIRGKFIRPWDGNSKT